MLLDLQVHLRKQGGWFPAYTCYNCMVSHPDRSSYLKHYYHCTREPFYNLRRLADHTVNTGVKIRLYQNYRCLKCNLIFSFHEDFCGHFDLDHMEASTYDPPYKCLCKQEFDDLELYRGHIHISCFLRYHCDMCSEMFEDMESFKRHCEEKHDEAEGVSYLVVEGFREMKSAKEDKLRSLKRYMPSIPKLKMVTRRQLQSRHSAPESLPVLKPQTVKVKATAKLKARKTKAKATKVGFF